MSLGENKVIYITPPPPYFILWNAVTSLGEQGYVLASSVGTKEVEVIEFYRIRQKWKKTPAWSSEADVSSWRQTSGNAVIVRQPNVDF